MTTTTTTWKRSAPTRGRLLLMTLYATIALVACCFAGDARALEHFRSDDDDATTTTMMMARSVAKRRRVLLAEDEKNAAAAPLTEGEAEALG